MSLSRRGFLGSVIGTLAVSQLPFMAEPAISSKFGNGLEDFRVSIFTNDGQEFWSPKAIPELITNDKISWVAETIVLNQRIEVAGFKLHAPDGSIAGKSYYAYGYINFLPGDKLNIVYSITFTGNVKKEEMFNWKSWIKIANKQVQMV